MRTGCSVIGSAAPSSCAAASSTRDTTSAVAAALTRLTADGLLDDDAFARAFVHDKRAAGGWGRARLERELARLGVPAAAVEAAVAGEGETEGDELARALAVLNRRPSPAPPYDGDKRRAFAALQRRGFATGIAYEAIRCWVAAARGAQADDGLRMTPATARRDALDAFDSKTAKYLQSSQRDEVRVCL